MASWRRRCRSRRHPFWLPRAPAAWRRLERSSPRRRPYSVPHHYVDVRIASPICCRWCRPRLWRSTPPRGRRCDRVDEPRQPWSPLAFPGVENTHAGLAAVPPALLPLPSTSSSRNTRQGRPPSSPREIISSSLLLLPSSRHAHPPSVTPPRRRRPTPIVKPFPVVGARLPSLSPPLCCYCRHPASRQALLPSSVIGASSCTRRLPASPSSCRRWRTAGR